MNSRRLMFVVLAALLVFGLALSLVAAWRSGDWWGFALNLGTELVGAVAVYILFDQFIERKEQTEAEKERLIAELASSVNDVAKAAAEKLAQNGWFWDGSLQRTNMYRAYLHGARLSEAKLRGADLNEADLAGARLSGADLSEANLGGADLGGADLTGADLTGADLSEARLVGANLGKADLSRANLSGVILNKHTTLPDGTEWTPGTDRVYLERFTDPNHPDFWRSGGPDSPACRGEDVG